MTLPGRFLRRPGRASAPVMMVVPPVRVGMGTGGGRGGTGPVGTDAAQPEDTAAGRLRPQRRHLLRKQTELLSSLPLRVYLFSFLMLRRSELQVVGAKVCEILLLYCRRHSIRTVRCCR